jgi:hypothetical protein
MLDDRVKEQRDGPGAIEKKEGTRNIRNGHQIGIAHRQGALYANLIGHYQVLHTPPGGVSGWPSFFSFVLFIFYIL